MPIISFSNAPDFSNERHRLFSNTRAFHPLSADKLLFGNENLTDDANQMLIAEVQYYIKHTRRF